MMGLFFYFLNFITERGGEYWALHWLQSYEWWSNAHVRSQCFFFSELNTAVQKNESICLFCCCFKSDRPIGSLQRLGTLRIIIYQLYMLCCVCLFVYGIWSKLRIKVNNWIVWNLKIDFIYTSIGYENQIVKLLINFNDVFTSPTWDFCRSNCHVKHMSYGKKV